MASATILGLAGATLIWTAIYFIWAIWSSMQAPLGPTDTEAHSVPVPAVGIIAMHYLLHFGWVPALSIMFAAGFAGLILAYVLVRRFR